MTTAGFDVLLECVEVMSALKGGKIHSFTTKAEKITQRKKRKGRTLVLCVIFVSL
jgi:hypothetical protein